jgi:hypothetical protein
MTCPNCGASVADNRRFCGKCGTALIADTPSDTPTAAPPSAWGTGGALTAPQPTAPPPPAAASGPVDPYAPPDLTPPGYAGPPPGYGPPAGYPPPPGYPAPAPGYGPPPGYAGPPPGYPGGAPGWPPYGYAPSPTNGLAIASLVLGIVGWPFCGIGSVIAIVLGFAARGQIKNSGGRQGGAGIATAGIVLGFIGCAFLLLFFLISLLGNSS